MHDLALIPQRGGNPRDLVVLQKLEHLVLDRDINHREPHLIVTIIIIIGIVGVVHIDIGGCFEHDGHQMLRLNLVDDGRRHVSEMLAQRLRLVLIPIILAVLGDIRRDIQTRGNRIQRAFTDNGQEVDERIVDCRVAGMRVIVQWEQNIRRLLEQLDEFRRVDVRRKELNQLPKQREVLDGHLANEIPEHRNGKLAHIQILDRDGNVAEAVAFIDIVTSQISVHALLVILAYILGERH
mmetsp:Transcript_698/g.1046  ORF Transcript_698/g.1046 Transcript_698/m.1046 type:complete len:238 (-) Transcript_698:220-933(-)